MIRAILVRVEGCSWGIVGPLRHGELDLAYGVTSKTVPQSLVLVPPLEVLPYRLPVLLKIRPV
jgi:hypothetical protein